MASESIKSPKKEIQLLGRPPKYKPEYCQIIIDYFDKPPWVDKALPHYGKEGEVKWVDLKRIANPLPKFHEFAKSIGVDEITLLEWSELKNEEGERKYPDFSKAYARAKNLQKWFLIENGLNNCYNPAFCIFVAKNVTDMRDPDLAQSQMQVKIKGDLVIEQRLENYIELNPEMAGHVSSLVRLLKDDPVKEENIQKIANRRDG